MYGNFFCIICAMLFVSLTLFQHKEIKIIIMNLKKEKKAVGGSKGGQNSDSCSLEFLPGKEDGSSRA